MSRVGSLYSWKADELQNLLNEMLVESQDLSNLAEELVLSTDNIMASNWMGKDSEAFGTKIKEESQTIQTKIVPGVDNWVSSTSSALEMLKETERQLVQRANSLPL